MFSEKYIKGQITERIEEKLNYKINELYNYVLPYILIIAISSFLLSFYEILPTHYYIYFSWHFIWIIIAIILYKKITYKKRIYLMLFKFLLSGIFIFYMEDYSIFAFCDLFVFIMIMSVSLKHKISCFVAGAVYIILIIKIYFINNGYIYSKITGTYEWVITYLIIFLGFLFYIYISEFFKKFIYHNLFVLEENMIELNRLAYYDSLTSIRNREYFVKEVDRAIKEGSANTAMALFNIRNIRSINLSYGSKMGDRVIKEIARILYENKNNGDIVARTSGNEFCIYIHLKENENRIEKIYNNLKEELKIENLDIAIEYYVACAYYEKDFRNFNDWFQKIMLTISHLKSKKREDIGYYKEEMGSAVLKKEKLYSELRKEIEKSGFSLHYQCKVDAYSGKIVGVEALARWESDTFGRVSPYEFIPMIEHLSLSKEFGNLVIRKAISDYEHIEKKYGEGVNLSINTSPSHILSADFKDTIVSILEEYNVSSKNIILEITEDVMIQNMDLINSIFRDLRNEGFRISLDDFGTGYSSLSYLFGLQIDEIKIDKSFVDSITISKRSEEFLNFIIDLSNMYNLDIVCEGVETSEQCELLMNLGCPIIQGYYFSKPAPIDEH